MVHVDAELFFAYHIKYIYKFYHIPLLWAHFSRFDKMQEHVQEWGQAG